MANTYTQLHIQFVFAVKNRASVIPREKKDELHKFITGIIKNDGHKMLAVHCMPDHVHLFIGVNPIHSISKIIQTVKANSSRFINDKGWVKSKFSWQEGYGAFSYSHSHIDQVVIYIQNQELHHKKTPFREEYLLFLEKFNIAYKPEYLFDWVGSTVASLRDSIQSSTVCYKHPIPTGFKCRSIPGLQTFHPLGRRRLVSVPIGTKCLQNSHQRYKESRRDDMGILI